MLEKLKSLFKESKEKRNLNIKQIKSRINKDMDED